MKKSIILRGDPLLKKALDDIKVCRIKNGLDTRLRSDRRLTKAMIRTDEWKSIERKLKLSKLEDKNDF
jgi:hypothetical protein